MKKNEPKDDSALVHELLGEDFAQQVVRELGLTEYSPDAQAEFIESFGTNILLRVTLEIVNVLPEDVRAQFDSYIDSGDIVGLRQFLLPHIPDLDRFIQHEVTKEYEATKTRTHEISQGINI